MKRPLFGMDIRQKSKSEFISANDLVLAGNKWRADNNLPLFSLPQWIRSTAVKEFIHELESNESRKVVITSVGPNGGTWLHPYLAIDLALALNPKFKVEVYSWLYDCLLKYRNDSGDSYKRMCGALYINTTKKSRFSEAIKILGSMIKKEVGVFDWESATQYQLEHRDKIYEYITLMCDVFKNNNNEAVRIGMMKAKEYLESKKEKQ